MVPNIRFSIIIDNTDSKLLVRRIRIRNLQSKIHILKSMPRILIVDDNEDFSAALATALNRVGYEVARAQDGKLGLKLYRESKFDLVISDILMPEVDGLELIFALRKNNATVPIIAMSGGGHGSAEHYLKVAGISGANAVLCKPFNPIDLIELVQRQLSDAKPPGVA